MKSLLPILLLVTVLSGCSRYQLDNPSDRTANETIARKLYEPLNRYLKEHGKYPENLSELKPDYAKELPTTVVGHQFKYSTFPNLSRNGIHEFSISWYQSPHPSSSMNHKIIGCNVRRTRSKSGKFSETSECWNAEWQKNPV